MADNTGIYSIPFIPMHLSQTISLRQQILANARSSDKISNESTGHKTIIATVFYSKSG